MLYFGTAGIPHSAKGRPHDNAVREVKRLGLDCMEVEFVYGVRMKKAEAEKVALAREESGITLTAHGPYYVNLASKEPPKKKASIERIIATARTAHIMGAKSVTFHAAFYQGRDSEEVYDIVSTELRSISEYLSAEGNEVLLRPELTGKPSQFGSLEELIRLSREVPGVAPCLDLAHMAARASGKGNSYKGIRQALDLVAEELGGPAIKDMHIHLYGIEWGAKGEIRHVPLKDTRYRWKAALRALVDAGASGVVICESPLLEEDALKLKKEYNRLKRSVKE